MSDWGERPPAGPVSGGEHPDAAIEATPGWDPKRPDAVPTMLVTDREEWLHPDAVHDEVVLEVDEPATSIGRVPPAAGPLLTVSLVVTPAGRRVHLVARVGGARARHDAEAVGPPPTNWDRMRLGGVEWRMVEPLRRWDLSVEDLEAGLRAYLSFSGTAPPTRTIEGYEQVGTVSGQVQLAELRTTLTNVTARRAHTWR